MHPTITFTSEHPNWSVPSSQSLVDWLIQVAEKHGHSVEQVSYLFCGDPRILQVNKAFLQHDYPTDIITFPYQYEPVIAELYISIDTVRSNADYYKVSFHEEFLRVVAHGLLHMLGFNDKTEEESTLMRQEEEKTIQLFEALYPNIVIK